MFLTRPSVSQSLNPVLGEVWEFFGQRNSSKTAQQIL